MKPNASVWVVDSNLSMFTNITEDMAARLSEKYKNTIYFFAELSNSEV